MANGQERMRVSPAELQKYLKGVSYPVSKEDLINAAQNNGAPAEIVEKIKQLASDMFNGPQDVIKELGKTE